MNCCENVSRRLFAGLFTALALCVYDATAQVSANDLTYRVVAQRPITNGGYSRTIVVNKAGPSESELRALGEKLKKDTKADRNAIVWAYDDERAARNRNAALAETLSKKETKHHDRHYVAIYMRIASSGHHEYQYYPKGFDGPDFRVNY